MKLAEYLFWKFWKFRVKKEQDLDSAYFFATMFYGLFFIFIPLIIILKNYDNLPILPESKTIQYVLIIPTIFVSSIPFKIIFPKKKIFSLEYTDLDKKRYNNKLFLLLLIAFFLICLRIYFMKKN
jgi:hypothetical protein